MTDDAAASGTDHFFTEKIAELNPRLTITGGVYALLGKRIAEGTGTLDVNDVVAGLLWGLEQLEMDVRGIGPAE